MCDPTGTKTELVQAEGAGDNVYSCQVPCRNIDSNSSRKSLSNECECNTGYRYTTESTKICVKDPCTAADSNS